MNPESSRNLTLTDLMDLNRHTPLSSASIPTIRRRDINGMQNTENGMREKKPTVQLLRSFIGGRVMPQPFPFAPARGKLWLPRA